MHIVDDVQQKFLYCLKTKIRIISQKLKKKLKNWEKRQFLSLSKFEITSRISSNGAIIHYRANNKTNRKPKKWHTFIRFCGNINGAQLM